VILGPAQRSSEQFRITPETGLRMSRALGLSDRHWLNIQLDYDVEVEKDRHTAELDAIHSLTA
jgi:antitoxin HigA-1